MTTGQLIIGAVIVLFIIALIMFPGLRTLLKGFMRVFLKDMAATPEGASAIYEEKINDAQDAYNKADDAYKMVSGKLKMKKDELTRLEKQLKSVEQVCESLVKAGNIDAAELKTQERADILVKIENAKTMMSAYEQAKSAAEEAYKGCEKRLRRLQEERNRVVENLKTKQSLKEVYDDLDELKKLTPADKMLDHVREVNSNLDAMVAGAKASHDAKLSTRLEKADEAAKKASTNDYLEALKKKYNK